MTYEYDEDNNVTSATTYAGRTINYEIDPLNRLQEVIKNGELRIKNEQLETRS